MKRQIAVMTGSLAVAAALLAPGPALAASFPLQAWWPFNEGKGQTLRDLSGKKNHGVLGSSTTIEATDPSWITGNSSGSALRFDGADWATIPDSASLQPQLLTVSLWFRANSSPGSFKYLLAHGADSCTAASYGLQTGFNGDLSFLIWDGSSGHASGQALAVQVWDGRWHHAAGTWDGTTARLFIDGQAVPGPSGDVATIDYGGPIGPLSVGAFVGSCELAFTGDLDEIKIWSAALPVDQLWNKQRSLFSRPPTP